MERVMTDIKGKLELNKLTLNSTIRSKLSLNRDLFKKTNKTIIEIKQKKHPLLQEEEDCILTEEERIDRFNALQKALLTEKETEPLVEEDNAPILEDIIEAETTPQKVVDALEEKSEATQDNGGEYSQLSEKAAVKYKKPEKAVFSRTAEKKHRRSPEITRPKSNFTRYKKRKKGQDIVCKKDEKREVTIHDYITIQELAGVLNKESTEIQKIARKINKCIPEYLEYYIAALIAIELNFIPRYTDVENKKSSATRPPVVTIMGHVDHGKTTLLDKLRNAAIANSEYGGITQHIGAYQLQKDKTTITFIDTPGHAAFTAIRARGARVTDIVVLVIAANDGIKQQTIEAIEHAKVAGVAVIVAINKIDLPDANIAKVKSDLVKHGLLIEEMGGDILVVEISAKTGENLDNLLEMISLQGELLELKANMQCHAKGIVIESKITKHSGVSTTLLVQRGTLQQGNIIVIESGVYGKVRRILDCQQKQLKSAIPAMPVEVYGLPSVATAGSTFYVTASEKQAKTLCEAYINWRKEKVEVDVQSDIDTLFTVQDDKELMLIIKADVYGSLEAIEACILKLATDECRIKILHTSVGEVSESDILLAEVSKAMIIAFNVKIDNRTQSLIKQKNISVHCYTIIYELLEAVEKIIHSMHEPTVIEKRLGQAEIRQIFSISDKKAVKVAGCYVTDGVIHRNDCVKLLRDNNVIYEGKLQTLKRFKDNVTEVRNGFECGIILENYNAVKIGDIIETFIVNNEA